MGGHRSVPVLWVGFPEVAELTPVDWSPGTLGHAASYAYDEARRTGALVSDEDGTHRFRFHREPWDGHPGGAVPGAALPSAG